MSESPPKQQNKIEIGIGDLPKVLEGWVKRLVEKGFDCKAYVDERWNCNYLDFGDFYVFVKVEGQNLFIKNVFSVNKENRYFTNAFLFDLLPLASEMGIRKIIADNVSPNARSYWGSPVMKFKASKNPMNMELVL